jgi:hypothetical protein
MGFKEIASNIATTAFNVFSSLQQSCTYRSKASESPVYDPATGIPSGTYNDIPVSMIFTSYRSDEVNSNIRLERTTSEGTEIRLSDMKALLAQTRLPVVPKMNDVVILDGATWEVVRVTEDPAKALWTFQLRKP